MKELTREEKLKLIFHLVEKHHITAYEIGENTELNTSGVHRILSKEILNPRHKTLDIILNYLESRITGKHIPGHSNYEIEEKIHTLAEDPFNFGSDLGEIKKMLQNLQNIIRIDHDAIAGVIKKTYLNTEDLIDNGNKTSKSIASLISIINKKT